MTGPEKLLRRLQRQWLSLTSRSSAEYWDRRYRLGFDSGPGSYGELAKYKADILNDFVNQHCVRSVIEFGCGDGNQLSLARYPSYLGFDISGAAILTCIARFAGDPAKSFIWYDPLKAHNLPALIGADLTLSLDVIYHLLEEEVYRIYLEHLFGTAARFVIIYSSNRHDSRAAPHVRHRKFADDVEHRFPHFRLMQRIPNPHSAQTFAEFFIYERSAVGEELGNSGQY